MHIDTRLFGTETHPERTRRGLEEAPSGPVRALTPTHALALQQTAGNHAVTRMLQRKIEPGRKDYATSGQRVTHSHSGHGVGRILEVVQNGYTVDFGSNTFYVGADDLDLVVDDDTEKVDSPPVDPPKLDEGEKSKDKLEEKEPKPKAPPDYTPMMLVVTKAKSGNDWTLQLQNKDGKDVGTLTGVKQTEVKLYLVAKGGAVEQPASQAKAGTYKLKPSPNLRALGKEHEEFKVRQAQLDMYESMGVSSGNGTPPPAQLTVFKRLNDLFAAMKAKHEKMKELKQKLPVGDPNVQMTQIGLKSAVILRVGGKDRRITHLYTQVGNTHERRCYLGTVSGVYQRVHTSITDDDKKTSHTMIQTGKKVVIPPLGEGGTRVGYDAQENASKPGYANRPVTARSTGQSTVGTHLIGQQPKDLEDDESRAGVRLLMQRFNQALDLVLVDISQGEASTRSVAPLAPGFATLDNEWTFDAGTTTAKEATPKEEFTHSIPSSFAAPLESTDKELDKTVDVFPGVDEVVKLYDIGHVSGKGWLCFVRAVLMGIGKGPAELVALYRFLLMDAGINLADLEGVGVEARSKLATQILDAIAAVTGIKVQVVVLVPRDQQAPHLEPSSAADGANVVVHLLHTGAHFSLARPK